MSLQSLMLSLSDSDRLLLTERLTLLMRKQTEKYAGFESSSVPEECARSILESLLFTLDFVCRDKPALLLSSEPEELLAQGQALLREKCTQLRELWQYVCLNSHRLRNVYYEETLKNIGGFFRRYDLRYAAHEIPCSIDYPLLVPVSEDRKGVDFIEDYLRRILLENRFLLSLDSRRLQWFLRSSLPDYENAYLNLCEAAFDNSLAHRLLGLPLRSVSVTDAQRSELSALFAGAAGAESEAMLRNAGAAIAPKGGEAYFSAAAASLLPRIHTALEYGHLENIFIT